MAITSLTPSHAHGETFPIKPSSCSSTAHTYYPVAIVSVDAFSSIVHEPAPKLQTLTHISIDLWCFAWNIIIYDSTVKPPSNMAQTCKRNKIILHTCVILEFWMMVGQTAHFTPRCKDACNYGRVIYVFNPVVVVVATRPSKTRACRCSHLIGLQRV